MYKLIATDLDETLLTKDKKITSTTVSILKKAQENGIRIVIATGRPFEGIKEYIKQLGIYNDNNYSIIYNGAKIISNFSGSIITEKFITGEDLHELYNLGKKFGASVIAYVPSYGCITPKIDQYSISETKLSKIKTNEMNFDKIKDTEHVIKFIMVQNSKLIDNAYKNIPEYIKNKYYIARSTPDCIEFLKKGTNKGTGLQFLAEKLGIKKNEIISFGDGGNDINMIKFAGMGVAMANAFNEVKKVCDFVTLTNQEDGVAYAVKKFCNI